MMTEGAREALDQLESWRQARNAAQKREAAAVRSAKRSRIAAALFAAAAIALGVLAGLLGRDVPRLVERVAKAEAEIAVLEVSAAYHQGLADDLRKELRSAQDALNERAAADLDLLERLGRAEEALGAHEDAIRRAGFDTLEEALDHATVHHGQLSRLADRYGWCLRDRDAAQCALGGEPGCNPSEIDYGGVTAGKGTP